MKNILFNIAIFFTVTFGIAQRVSVQTDSCIVLKHKFILSEQNSIAKIQAFSGDKEIPVKKTIKMAGPVYFLMKNGTENTLLQDNVFAPNGDIATVFAIVGNEVHPCALEGRNIQDEDQFCGRYVQGVIISPDGITLTDHVAVGLACIKENYLGMKDLFSFAEMELAPEQED